MRKADSLDVFTSVLIILKKIVKQPMFDTSYGDGLIPAPSFSFFQRFATIAVHGRYQVGPQIFERLFWVTSLKLKACNDAGKPCSRLFTKSIPGIVSC